MSSGSSTRTSSEELQLQLQPSSSLKTMQLAELQQLQPDWLQELQDEAKRHCKL